jgi:hypothetical protein
MQITRTANHRLARGRFVGWSSGSRVTSYESFFSSIDVGGTASPSVRFRGPSVADGVSVAERVDSSSEGMISVAKRMSFVLG